MEDIVQLVLRIYSLSL